LKDTSEKAPILLKLQGFSFRWAPGTDKVESDKDTACDQEVSSLLSTMFFSVKRN